MSTKKRVLELLENNRGQNISGEYIANQLNITRNSVWKAVKELEKDGHKIKAVTNRGYCLCDCNDILSVEGMLPFLRDKMAANKIHIYACLESTNKTAKEMAISGAEHGTIIIADCQTAGKGRYNRNFFSPPGHGIYMSFILRPSQMYQQGNSTLITSYAAVSVCEAIEAVTDKTPRIKWVNDIFLNGKKICGILSEAVTDFESGNIQWVVVGIGINFTMPEGGFPDDIKDKAGVVFFNDKPITRNRLIVEIANRMLDFGNQTDSKFILANYKKRLFMLGKKILVTGINEPFEAVAIDIDDAGHLIVKMDTGKIISLAAGEVSLCMQQGLNPA